MQIILEAEKKEQELKSCPEPASDTIPITLVPLRFQPLLPTFQQYLLVGGFPETATLKNTGLCQRLLREDVVERVLKREMTALFGVATFEGVEDQYGQRTKFLKIPAHILCYLLGQAERLLWKS